MSVQSYQPKHTDAWTMFSVLTFIISATMMAGGIYFLEASFAAKGFYAMAAIMLVHTSITVTKTLRDVEESKRMVNKLEDAKTERLLMEMGRSETM